MAAHGFSGWHDIPKIHRMPYWHIWSCRNGLDGRMITIEGAFESSDIVLFDQKKFGNARTHPEELRVVKRKKCSQIHTISSKIYFSLRVVLRDEFLRYRIFSDQQEWCLSSQKHLQARSFDHSIHLYNLMYTKKALCAFLVYIKFSPKWIKTIRDGMRTSDTDLKSLNLIFYTLETLKTSCACVNHVTKFYKN